MANRTASTETVQKPSKPLVFGHRGASYDAPENTLAAFREAWRQGADGIEGDYHSTADKHVVCIHDETTLRTGGRNLVLAESTLTELQELEYGAWKAERFRGEPLPLVQDVAATVLEGRWLILELKTGPEIVGFLVKALEGSGVNPDRMMIIAFDEGTIAESKRLLPKVKAHWLTDYRWDEVERKWLPTIDEIVATIQRCGADGLGSENKPEVVTREFIHQLQSAGIDEFHVWTVDKPDDAVYYQELGAMGVTSNCPGLIRDHLSAAGR